MPPDPRQSLSGPLDPTLEAIRGELGGHRARLWLRRIVRRTWVALAAIAVAEAVLWTVARFVPLEAAPVIAVAIPIVVGLVLLVAVVRARPSIGETALAVDVEGGLGDRVSSRAGARCRLSGVRDPPVRGSSTSMRRVAAFDEAAETDRFVRRQRRDALATLRMAPRLFKPRFSREPSGRDGRPRSPCSCRSSHCRTRRTAVIAKQREVREAAERQAQRIDAVAQRSAGQGRGRR